MHEEDFNRFGIDYFTANEITGTGARLQDVQSSLICAVNDMRGFLKRKIILMLNGLTSGQHKSKWHRSGMACDFALSSDDGPVDIVVVIKAALEAGFRGIGVYWNGVAYSFHVDLRDEYSFWGATPANLPGQGWSYQALFADPRNP